MKAKRVNVPGWNYIGDVNLECGGLFFKYEGFDYCEAVRIVPASDMGGPDNLFRIETGTIWINPEKFDSAVLSGFAIGPPELAQVIQGFESYSGLDLCCYSGVTNLAIGKPEKIFERGGEYNPTPDIQTHGNAKLHCAILQFLK